LWAWYRADVSLEAATPLPLFPLANVVLFPHSRVPLHIFEPRYLQMTEAALEGERCIGMVTVRPEAIADIAGNPPVFPIGCSGVIEQIVKRPNGRFDLVLHGTHRFRIVEEIPSEGQRIYRLGKVEQLADRFEPTSEQAELQTQRVEIVELLEILVRRADPSGRARFDPRRLSGIDDEAFVNVMCQVFDGGAAEKQGLLDADELLERCRRLVAVLRFRVAEREGTPGSDSIQ
jgi:Lon protease-like protein